MERIYDVGVVECTGLFSRLEIVEDAGVLWLWLAWRALLPACQASLVSRPVIMNALRLGYGANFHGLSALLTMVNSCANGIATVNIDNGYGGGYLATQMNRLALGK